MSELQLERMTSYYTGTGDVTRSKFASTWESIPSLLKEAQQWQQQPWKYSGSIINFLCRTVIQYCITINEASIGNCSLLGSVSYFSYDHKVIVAGRSLASQVHQPTAITNLKIALHVSQSVLSLYHIYYDNETLR